MRICCVLTLSWLTSGATGPGVLEFPHTAYLFRVTGYIGDLNEQHRTTLEPAHHLTSHCINFITKPLETVKRQTGGA